RARGPRRCWRTGHVAGTVPGTCAVKPCAVRSDRCGLLGLLVPRRDDPDGAVVDRLAVEEALDQPRVRACGNLVEVREERRVDDLEPGAVALAHERRHALEDVAEG